jgi:hypothetical protein
MIYLHPGGWQNVDKDTGTLPFFSYLVAKGHLVMDVSYRLCHETDMWGMIGDVKRAIAWMKANAGEYGVDPERVVVSGGSAGGTWPCWRATRPTIPSSIRRMCAGGPLGTGRYLLLWPAQSAAAWTGSGGFIQQAVRGLGQKGRICNRRRQRGLARSLAQGIGRSASAPRSRHLPQNRRVAQAG